VDCCSARRRAQEYPCADLVRQHPSDLHFWDAPAQNGRGPGPSYFLSSLYTISEKLANAGPRPPPPPPAGAAGGLSPIAALISSSDLPCLTRATIFACFSSVAFSRDC